MKTIILKKIGFRILFSFVFGHLHAQDPDGLRMHKHWEIRGSATVTGNNIVSIDAKKPYDLMGYGAEKNDALSLVYVDIDDDPSTFSSSSSKLDLPDREVKIVYAGLYWSAIYEYGKGIKKREGHLIHYEMKVPREPGFDQVKLKVPGGHYMDVQGSILVDRLDSTGKPYLCYADVTELVVSSAQQGGQYTVANMKATQGYTIGGSAGGWVLFVVYEDPEEPYRSILAYRGFELAEQQPKKVLFNGFTTPASGAVKSSLILAALEGDESIKTDQCVVVSPSDSTLVPLGSKIRNPKNFFNSTITYGHEYLEERTPNSRNTLGFDIAMFEIPNKDNGILSNGANELELQFLGNRDKFFLFFAALQIESAQPIDGPIQAGGVGEIKHTEAIADGLRATEKEKAIKAIRESWNIASEKPGYYLVTNVFSQHEMAQKWKNFLVNEGYRPESFINPEKENWEYVHILRSDDLLEVYQQYRELKQIAHFKEIWILKMNM